MKVYHGTAYAKQILGGGFKDAEGTWGTGRSWRGVWLSAEPASGKEGAAGPVVLALEIPEGVLAEYEWVQDVGYREFLVPAKVVNRFGPPEVVEDQRWAKEVEQQLMEKIDSRFE
jgi:hypothetical protein